MSKGYEAPVEVRELEKLINDFTYRNGLDVRTVFHDLLRYIINGFSIPGSPPLSHWKYSKEQNKVFYEMFATWIGIMDKQIKIHGWYDALGDLFMAPTSQRGQQQKGQFFTPDHISELCQRLTMDKEDAAVKTVYDPAAGSGRMLISTKAASPRNYLIAWDIDYTCCLMCVCNFLMNSCVGEVVCVDTLRMNDFRGAWVVNEIYYRTGLPSIRWMNEQEYLLFKQSNIPAYVSFLDQERYDEYFKMKKMFDAIKELFPDNHRAVDESA